MQKNGMVPSPKVYVYKYMYTTEFLQDVRAGKEKSGSQGSLDK